MEAKRRLQSKTKTWKQRGDYSQTLDDDFAKNLKNPDFVMILAILFKQLGRLIYLKRLAKLKLKVSWYQKNIAKEYHFIGEKFEPCEQKNRVKMENEQRIEEFNKIVSKIIIELKTQQG